MNKNILLILLLTACSAFAAVTLDGVVLNASTDSSAVAAAPVILYSMTETDPMPNPLDETQSNTRGRFTFQLDAVEPQKTYFVSTDHLGVRYYSGAADFDSTLTLVVHDTTQSPDNVNVLMHHIIVQDAGGTVFLRQTRMLQNNSAETITDVYDVETIGKGIFRFDLPQGALNFTPISAQMEGEFVAEDGVVYDKGIMMPGNRQVSYSYELPWRDESVSARFNLGFPTETLDVFISSPNVRLESEQFQDMGEFNIRGANYHRYHLDHAHVGESVEFKLNRIGGSGGNPSPALPIIATSALLLTGLIISRFQKNGQPAA